jgi:hypothetical protein
MLVTERRRTLKSGSVEDHARDAISDIVDDETETVAAAGDELAQLKAAIESLSTKVDALATASAND